MKEQDEKPFMSNREVLSDMYKKTLEMHSVVMGNPTAKVKGLHERVEAIEKNDRDRGMFVTVISLLSMVGAFLITNWKKLFG